MILIDTDNILLNENAYFYRRAKKLSKAAILNLFKQSTDHKNAKRAFRPIVRKSLFEGSKEVAKFSLDIFQYSQKPSFFDKPKELWETKTGLFLILEHDEYVAIIRKNVSGVFALYRLCEEIDYSVLSNFLASNKTRFEKIISNNLNTAENAVQTKTAEAKDLKGVLSRFGISKQIISALRIDNEGEKSAISLNTSRVNSLNVKGKFENVLFWLVKIIKLINAAYTSPKNHPFISGFATPVNFEDIIQKVSPTYLFLRFNSLIDSIDNNEIESCYTIDEMTGDNVEFDLGKLIETNQRLFKLDKIDSRNYESEGVKLKINVKSISINSEEFKKVIIKFENQEEMPLNTYINHMNHFIVTFDKIEYAYTHRKIFKDHKLLGDLDSFLETFIPFKELSLIKTEKGEHYTSRSSTFSQNSIFSFVDKTLLKDHDCVICDDMGTEWGDFISISQDEIAFYHCKHNKDTLSASQLEVVFGQAQKNLGYLELNEEMLASREKRWKSNYNINKVKTKIPRIRHCLDSKNPLKSVKDSIQKASGSGNLKRKVFVVINFLSKSDLETSLKKVKDGQTFDNKGVTLQILWFVNSLLSSAHELGVEFRIICRP